MAYSKRVLATGTTFMPENHGVWLMADFTGSHQQDLVYIKTSKTGTNSVEVHVASAASNYQKRVYESGSTFREENDRTWLMRPFSQSGNTKPHLIFIKTANTGTNSVEVQVASSASKYMNRVLETGTTFKNETDGVWTMVPSGSGWPDLVFIKTGPVTGTGRVEVHIASGANP